MCIRDRYCLRAFGGGCITAGDGGVVHVWDDKSLVAERRPEIPTPDKSQHGGEGVRAVVDVGDASGGTHGWSASTPPTIKAMHLWGAGEEVRLVTGHASGVLCWWG